MTWKDIRMDKHEGNLRSSILVRAVSRLPYSWLIFAAVALWLEWPVVLHPYTEVVGGIPDTYQYTWYIGWFWHAVAHGLNPFYSYEINWPHGFGLMYNTSVIAISVLFGWLVPITSTVFVYNLVFFINIFLIGCFGRGVLRECGVRPWLSTWGGIMFCMMPYLTAQELGHMSQYFIAPVFVAVYLFVRCMNGKSSQQVIYGLAIGVLCAVEFYTSLEVTVTCLLTLFVFVICLVIQKGGRKWTRIHFKRLTSRFWVPMAVTAVIPLLPGIIEFFLTGGLSFGGIEMHPDSGGYWVSDFLSPWFPTRLTLLHTAITARVTTDYFPGTPEEKGNYIGVFLVAGAIILRKSWKPPVSRSLIWMTITMFILSLGNQVHVFGQAVPIILPWIIFSQVPFLHSALPIRLALYIDMSLVFWVTMSLEYYLLSRGSFSIRRQIWPSLICLLSLVSWMPTIPYPHASVYSLPKAIVQRIGSQPVYWITSNFGYDMQALSETDYDIKTYNMYGFSALNTLDPSTGGLVGQFQFSTQNGSRRVWADQLRVIQQSFHTGYVLLTPFDPGGADLQTNLKQVLNSSLGRPVMQVKGCDLWVLK